MHEIFRQNRRDEAVRNRSCACQAVTLCFLLSYNYSHDPTMIRHCLYLIIEQLASLHHMCNFAESQLNFRWKFRWLITWFFRMDVYFTRCNEANSSMIIKSVGSFLTGVNNYENKKSIARSVDTCMTDFAPLYLFHCLIRLHYNNYSFGFCLLILENLFFNWISLLLNFFLRNQDR